MRTVQSSIPIEATEGQKKARPDTQHHPWLAFTAADAGCLWHEYAGLCWFGSCLENDFTIAYRLAEFPSIGPGQKSVLTIFVVAAYLMQGAIIALAWFAFLQILMHSIAFVRFEALRYPSSGGLSIRLNHKDPLFEFGLADINRAINITYIFIALAMLVPVLSAYSQPNPDYADFGQLALRILLPLLLLVPTVIPFIERLKRSKDVADHVRALNTPEDSKAYSEQHLWPFDRALTGYIGKSALGIAVAEYTYLFTRNFPGLLDKVRGFIGI